MALILSLGAPVLAGGRTPEAVSLSGVGAFKRIAMKAAKPFTAKKHVSLQGRINLRGSGYVGNGSRWLSVTLDGYTTIDGDGGKITTGHTRISHRETFFLSPGQRHVYRSVRVSAYVNLYRDGKYIGSTNVSGYIPVSGWINGSWVNLSGYGSLTGSVFVRDEEAVQVDNSR